MFQAILYAANGQVYTSEPATIIEKYMWNI